MDCFQLEMSCEELRETLKVRKDLLEQLLAVAQDRLRGSPEGRIRVTHKKKYALYYFKERATDRWMYVSVKEHSKVRRIINRDYLEDIISQASEELREINHFLNNGFPISLETVYQEFSPIRQSFIQPLFPTSEEVVEEFCSFSYDPLEFFQENKLYETGRGEKVRSKAEWMIAQKLAEHGVPYQYEAPLHLKGAGTVRPDFRCLNVHRRKIVFWEHMGKMGDNEYASEALRKVRAYASNGFHVAENLIITEETADCPLIPSTVEYWIKRMLLE